MSFRINMKKRLFCIFIFSFLTISCTYNGQYKENNEMEQTEQPQSAQPGVEKENADDLYRILKHEVDVIISDDMRIGSDHYQRLVAKLDKLEETRIPGTSTNEIRSKIEQIKNQNVLGIKQQATAPKSTDIEREINVLYDSGNIIGPEHYSRLKSELEKLEQQKYDVVGLRQKLDKLNPSLIDANKTTPLSATQAFDKKVFDTLPSCTGQKFTAAPVDIDELYEISPLGSIGVPGHTLPTPHMYFHISAGGASTKTVPLRAPADAYIISVTESEGGKDYSMAFGLCKDIFGYYNHIKELSNEIKAALDKAECVQFAHNPGNLCVKDVQYKVNAGTLLGYVGGLQGNFDLGAYDYRIKLGYVNQASYGDLSATGLGRPRLLSVVCPIDLFEENVKSQLYSKIKRQAEPRCGNVMQDIKGALQGSWFYSDGRADLEWAKHLSFVYDNNEPSIAIVAVAGTISEPIKWTFTPQSFGTKNRKFSDVIADKNVYCYEGSSGRIIVQLTSDTELKIEYQNGYCSGNYQFVNPFMYHR